MPNELCFKISWFFKIDFFSESIPAFQMENNVSHTLGEDVSTVPKEMGIEKCSSLYLRILCDHVSYQKG